MTKCLIKICGIRNADTAKAAAIAGAHMIGIVFHPLSSRYIHPEQAAAVSYAAKRAGAIPVAVFVNQSHDEMQHICQVADIQAIQLHGSTARATHHLLPKSYQRIYVQTVSEHGELQIDHGVQSLNPDRDLILIDHTNPGQGHAFNRTHFRYNLPFPWMLAGGLTASNVAASIQALKPDGVDVSSGVEDSKGNKDITLIQQFILSANRGLYESE